MQGRTNRAPRARTDHSLHEILHGQSNAGAVTFFLVRHGKTTLNDETSVSVDRERGWSDVPLTAEGRQEARAAALKLKSKGIEAIVSSDLRRAKETAQIIGQILGIKPEFSYELRPWNLGKLTGVVMKEATPQIETYAKQPDRKDVTVPESFNEFRARAMRGLAEALAKHEGETVLIVAHHRVERLFEASREGDQVTNGPIDLKVFMDAGEPPGAIEMMRTSEIALKGSKAGMDYQDGYQDPAAAPAPPQPGDGRLSHAQVKYGLAKPGSPDKCATCKAFNGRNDCEKVVPPIAPAAWCAVGVSRADGHRFDPQGEQIEQQGAAPGPGDDARMSPPPMPDQAAAGAPPNTLAHGRAIAGAKALHAVGHISAQERDKHVAASQKAIGRKPFGSFAP